MSSILISVLLIVEVLAAFLLIVVILAQKSKDQGLGMAFGSGMGESLFGSRAGNVLTRMTVTLASVFMVTTILLGILFANRAPASGSVMDSVAAEAPAVPAAAPAAAPAQPAPMGAEEAPLALPAAEPAGPVTLQMGADGELAPMEAAAPAEEAAPAPAAEEPAVEPAAPAAEEVPAEAAPAAEGESAPQD